MEFGNLSEKQRADRIIEVIRKIVEMFRENRVSSSPLDVRRIMMKQRLVIRLIRTLPQDRLTSVYEALKTESKSSQNKGLETLLYDSFINAGTEGATQVVNHYVKNNGVTRAQQLYYLLAVPLQARFPTKQFIQMFKNTVEQFGIDDKRGQIGLLSLSSLVYQACVNQRVAKAKYPIEITGRFCSPSFAKEEVYEHIIQKVWDRVMHTSNKEQKAVVLTALQILGIPEILPKLERVVESASHSTYIRTKAVFAFSRLIFSENGNEAVSKHFVRSTVLPKLLQYVLDRNLPTPVRMAAAALIFKSEHSTQHQWEDIARSAVQSNQEFQSFVVSSWHTMQEMEAVTDNHRRMKHLARQVTNGNYIEQILRTGNTGGISQNLYFAEELGENTEIEYFQRFALIRSHRNNEFLQTYFKEQLNFGAYSLPLGIKGSLIYQSDAQSIWRQRETFVQFSLFNSVFVVQKLNQRNLMQLVEQTTLGQLFRSWMEDSNSFSSRVDKFSEQRFFQPIELLHEVPTVAGYPVSFRMSTPVIVSSVGQITTKGSGDQARVLGEVYLTAVAQMKARLTIKVPYVQKYYQTGYERNIALELPVKFVAQKSHRDVLQVALTLTHIENHSQPQGKIRLFSYDQIPYNAIIQDPWTTSVAQRYESFDTVRTGRRPEQEKIRVGREELGYKFIYEDEADRPTYTSRHWQEMLYRSLNVVVDLSQSRTNTVLLTMAMGHASQYQHSSGSTSSESSSDSSDSSQGNSVEDPVNFANSPVLVIAVTGKKGVVQSLDKQATTVNQIDSPHSKNQFQFLAELGLSNSMNQLFFRVARGSAADKAAKNLPNNGPLGVARQAITESDNEGEQNSYCFQVNHKVREESREEVHGKTDVQYGYSCASMSTLQVQTLFRLSQNKVKADIEITKGQSSLPQKVRQFLDYVLRKAAHYSKETSAIDIDYKNQNPLRAEVSAYSAQYRLQKALQSGNIRNPRYWTRGSKRQSLSQEFSSSSSSSSSSESKETTGSWESRRSRRRQAWDNESYDSPQYRRELQQLKKQYRWERQRS
jgi:hypothetical protein